MKIVLKIIFLLILFLTINNCIDYNPKKKQIVYKDYGRLIQGNDSLNVELHLDDFGVFQELIDRSEEIICNDSLPVLIIENDSLVKTIYFNNQCPTGAPILVRYKNVIEIHNDSVVKNNKFYSKDSLGIILRGDIENLGKKPELSDSPDKLLIYISYSVNGIKKIEKTLDILTNEYESMTGRTDIKITLQQRVYIPPPPMPIPLIIN